MTNDPTIREQSLQYFLVEAPELLQAIEKELLSLRQDYTINKIYTLMRTTHTLKGAAASVGLETLKSVAHSLEDIFRAICKPDLSIDPEVEALLFEGYECLRLSLSAALTGGQVNDREILDRTAAVFAQLQEKLGDCFSQEAELPSSEELGFDLTQSIFEIGVAQRLDQLGTALASGDADKIVSTLQESMEIFQGLAQSLNLPGFGAIVEATLTALSAHPQQAVAIAEIAFYDFQKAQAAVVNGDRTQGGQPSLTLQHLAMSEEVVVSNHELDNHQNTDSLLEAIWGGDGGDGEEEEDFSFSPTAVENSPIVSNTIEESFFIPTCKEEPVVSLQTPQPSPPQEEPQPERRGGETPPQNTTSTPKPEVAATPIPAKEQADLSRTVRVKVEHLEKINYDLEELLINQNRQSLENEQLRSAVHSLISRLKQHSSLLDQLKDGGLGMSNQGLGKNFFPLPSQESPIFDDLELNRYSESEILIQSILEDTVQLAEAADAIDLFTRASEQTVAKQRRLLEGTRDALMLARMSPLGEIFNRFGVVLGQLETMHKKPVVLELHGREVLVDKVVVEKLYDPLLHLVRNAFDHGIESPTIRQQLGKPEAGRIEISAYQEGRYLVIEVRDDGQGLDFEKIRACAIERQFISPQHARSMSDAELTDLLFQPGFSTAFGVNDLSGRGIGLDVVKNQLEKLSGSIAVCSQRQVGTTFTLQIPLTLTIAKLLLAQAGGRTYALFTDAIASIIIPRPDQIRTWENGKVLRWGKGADERLVPIHQLSQVLINPVLKDGVFSPVSPIVSHKSHQPTTGERVTPLIIMHVQDAFLALEVDQLLGEQELVIRPLGQIIAAPNYIYGGSILADGRLTLVLDGTALIQYLLQIKATGSHDEPRHRYKLEASLDTDAPRHLPSATSRILSSERQQLPGQNHDSRQTHSDEAKPDKTVLIVDDSITVRQSLTLTLQKAGYQVTQASDGYEAMEQLQHHKHIDLVICDVEMPRMNGFEFLKQRATHPSLAQIPVVMLTSRSGDKHRTIASALGAIGYLTKPFLEHHLLANVKQLIERNMQSLSVIF
ncbi:MAG: hybrid sensor histidine kinase/response regulator [Nostocaceae cyanobacterium]|nr:hybrid sensor histidine kinase/response regulator [Nostocaceae cyanobacterium]